MLRTVGVFFRDVNLGYGMCKSHNPTTLNTDYIISQIVVFQYPHLFTYLHTILRTQSHTSI